VRGAPSTPPLNRIKVVGDSFKLQLTGDVIALHRDDVTPHVTMKTIKLTMMFQLYTGFDDTTTMRAQLGR